MGGSGGTLLCDLLNALTAFDLAPQTVSLCRAKASTQVVELILDRLDETRAQRVAQALSRVADVHNVTYAAACGGYGGSFSIPRVADRARKGRRPGSPP